MLNFAGALLCWTTCGMVDFSTWLLCFTVLWLYGSQHNMTATPTFKQTGTLMKTSLMIHEKILPQILMLYLKALTICCAPSIEVIQWASQQIWTEPPGYYEYNKQITPSLEPWFWQYWSTGLLCLWHIMHNGTSLRSPNFLICVKLYRMLECLCGWTINDSVSPFCLRWSSPINHTCQVFDYYYTW